MPYARALSTFRDGVRRLAVGKGDGAAALQDVLALCDRLRDADLVPLGVALDDQADGNALVKLVPPADFIRAREEKRAQAEAKMRKNQQQQQQQRQHAQRAAKLAKARIAPQDMFKPPHVPEGTYGSWDENGVPLTDGEGRVLSKNQGKRVAKEWAEQKKAHDGIK
jgi:cysteinyl-tRNA synthetase